MRTPDLVPQLLPQTVAGTCCRSKVVPPTRLSSQLEETGLLYNFNQFVSHASQPILADNGNNFFSILAGFGDLSDK